MESFIILSIIVLAFFFGQWDGKTRYKKHEVSIVKPEGNDPEAWKSFMTAVEAKIIFYGLADVRKEDGVIQHKITFYTEAKE